MTGFAIGLSAVGLWMVVLVGIVWLVRSSSGPPHRSIRRFKGDRIAIETARAAVLSERVAAPEPQVETEPHIGVEMQLETFTAVRLNSEGLVVTQDVDVTEEVQEIEALVGSVTGSREAAKPSAARRARPSGPRKKGRITYVLVDEEGSPLI